jgi:acetyl-CoA C-acetyltransferase
VAPDPRSPVVVGVGQVAHRVPAAEARAPVDLLADAARAAEADAGVALLARADVVAVVQIVSWRYPDAAAFLAERLGITPRATVGTTTGGNSPLMLAGAMAERIAGGDCDVVLLGGAEAMYTRWRARREPRVELTWPAGAEAAAPEVLGDDRPGTSEHEMAHGLVAPTLVYPLFETALRAVAGRSVDEHQRHVGRLWARFAAVAATNPDAWSRTAYAADELVTPSDDNRMVVFPYTKRMCSNIDVDQGAAVLMCSYEAAKAAGVADDRMVFLHATADAHDHWYVSERESLATSPAIGAVVRAALGASGRAVDDVARFDLYSCFPAAVQIAMAALGIADDDPRPLTTSGGLAFAGGPVNNYVTHGIATMVQALRGDPGSIGVTTGLGWYVTKHGAGVWSTDPPDGCFRRVPAAETQAGIDARPRRQAAGPFTGTATVEAMSVPFERDGTPSHAIVTALADDGKRVVARASDPAMAVTMTEEAWEGRRVRIAHDGSVNQVEG